jgi:serine protease Do
MKLSLITTIMALLLFFGQADAQKKNTKTKAKHKTTRHATAKHAAAKHKSKKHFAAKSREKNEETVFLDEDNGETKTTVEIKNGKVYVNGNEVSAMKNAMKEDRTIIINHKAPVAAAPREETMPQRENRGETMEHGSGKAMLGVYAGGSDDNNGAEITGVTDNSPADDAGLRTGDVITKVDDHNIRNAEDLVETIHGYSANDRVTITYERNGHSNTADVKLAGAEHEMEMPGSHGMGMENMDNFSRHMPESCMPCRPKLGIAVADCGNGVMVESVKPNSPADHAGLQKGDIITTINNEKITSARQLMNYIQFGSITGKLNIHYLRDGEGHTTEAELAGRNM